MAMNSAYELKGCYDFPHVQHPSVASLTEDEARLLKHGYYASVSFVDACLGKLLQGLEDLQLEQNTIVVVWGDHGWKLGEHGSWCKQTNYNIDVRVPLMVFVPGTSQSGQACDRLVELVDLYPTLCEAAKIEVPEQLEGRSMLPLLKDPAQEWKSAAFSQFHRAPRITPDGGRYMGYSMVTENFHYVEWRTWDHVVGKSGDEVVAVEIYDLRTDPEENQNVADWPDYQRQHRQLAAQLKQQWPKSL
jgi:arylsulfatase A-like enzyme